MLAAVDAGARRVVANGDTFPCRVSLAHAKVGEELLLVECDVLSGGKLVAYGVSTCMTLRGDQASGR